MIRAPRPTFAENNMSQVARSFTATACCGGRPAYDP